MKTKTARILSVGCFGILMISGSSSVDAQSVSTPTMAIPKAEPSVSLTTRQQKWRSATLDQRTLISEQLGEDGARALARKQGWKPIMDGIGRTLPQGPDQVWRSADGVIHVIEAKGGGSPLGNAYGYRQGSPEWAVKSAQRVLRSQKATIAERSAAEAVLKAATRGRLQVDVVRTSHVLGEPTAAVLEQSLNCTDDAAQIAHNILDDVTRGITTSNNTSRAASVMDDAARSLDDISLAGKSVAERGSATLRTVGRFAVPVAVVVDGGLRVNEGIQIEQRYDNGEINEEEREIEHARNVSGMVGGWGGAIAGAKLGALAGGAAGSAVAPGPGTAVGGAAGGLVGGVAGYVGGEAAAEAGAEWTVEQIHAAGTSVADVVDTAWDNAQGAAHVTADTAQDAWSWTAKKTMSGWNSTTRSVGHAWHWITD